MTNDWLSPGFTLRTVEANGARLSCAVGGSGPPMVLLHGWPQTGRAWRAVMPRLAEGHTVVVPDLRGAGSSQVTASGYRKLEQAEDVRALLRALDLAPPSVLVGHDIGGMVAYALAAQHPEEVEALVLIDLLVPGLGLEMLMDPAQGGMFHFGLFMTPDAPELLFAGHEQAFMAWWFARLSGKPGAIPAAEVAAYASAYTGADRLHGGFAQYRALLDDANDNRRLAQRPLPIPVLAIGGAMSVGGKLAEAMQPACESLRRAVAPCGHFVPEEAPDWLLAELGRFLAISSRTPGSGAAKPGLVARVLPAWIVGHLPGADNPLPSRVAVRGGTDSPGTPFAQHRGTRGAEVLWMAGDRYTVLLTSAETAGRLSLFHFLTPPGGGSPAHTHSREDETFYVLRGRVTFTAGGREFEVGPGETVFGPRGITHSFTNKGEVDAEMVCKRCSAALEAGRHSSSSSSGGYCGGALPTALSSFG